MGNERDEALEMFCTVMEMKEKKKALYEDAMSTCPDQVGIETFRMLRDSEVQHLKHVQETYEEIKKGKVWADACKYHQAEDEDRQALLRRIAEEHGKMPRACLDDVVAIETGLQLENSSIVFLQKQAEISKDQMAREFIDRLLTEEREHYILLADLKYYYVDPEAWFMEKSRSRLDGAGAVT
ncbi:MAG: hypothetical protein RBS57_15220 [Desulforhabdus sp.]|jgi:rubrerythrin|nr:hypothetical protein [Desulforhabdus sp.]